MKIYCIYNVLKNGWIFTGEGSRFLDVWYSKNVAVNDIVQFRLMDLGSEKIPICIDEATPYQREEFEGIDAHFYILDCFGHRPGA